MKKKRTLVLGTTIFAIKPWVLFRASHKTSAGLSQNLAIHVRNLKDYSFYELRGHLALLWLAIDGTRTVNQIIRNGKKTPTMARNILTDFLELNLIEEIPHRKKDKRATDMKEFLKKMNGKKDRKLSLKKKIKFKPEPGDHAAISAVRNKFSKLLKGGGKLRIKRNGPPFSGLRLQVFAAKLSWPDKKSETDGFGAALTVEGAATSAVGEEVERLFCIDGKFNIYAKSYNELLKAGHRALNPESYKRYSPTQDVLKNGEVVNLTKNTQAHWTIYEDALNNGRKILIPSELAKPEEQRNDFLPILQIGTSTGSAAHTDQYKAKLNGVLELIERDNVLFYWRTRNTPAQIDLSRAPEPIRGYLEKLGPLKRKIKLFYLKTDLTTITVQAVFLGDHSLGEPRFMHTAATRMNPIEAMEKALFELIYVLEGTLKPRAFTNTLYYGKNFDNSVWDFDDRGELYGQTSLKEAYSFLLPKNPKLIHPADIPTAERGNAKKNLEAVISDFRRNKLRLYFKNSTEKRLRAAGFWAFISYSPDLLLTDPWHRYQAQEQSRHYQLPKILGLKRRPKGPSDLSPWPNPIT